MAVLKDLIVQGTSRFIGRIYAPSGMEGTATKAEALTTNAGSSTLPVFFENGVPKAITSYSGKATSAGTADVATKLGTATVGSTSEPIYLNAGVPTKISYKIEKSVPSNAVFTDTTYSAGTGLSLSGTTFNHSNSITAVTTAAFKKFKYDAQGHITGTADVAASDLPDHTHNYVPNTQAGVNAALNLLSTGSSTPYDDDYYISQYANGGTTTTTYHRRPVSKLWDLFKTKISATNTSSGSVVIGVTQTDGAFTVTLGEPNVTVTNPTAQTSYGVLFAADPNTTERNVLRKNNNFRFREVLGTTSAEGAADIILGNAVAKGTANNLTGTIILYGDGAYNARIMPVSGMTAHRTITIPNKNGTFALTSDIVTYSFATGDEAGTIKVTPSGGTASNIRVHGLSHIAGDSSGMGIILQASGLTMVGAGESATALQSALSLGGATELLYLSSDQHIHFYTNCQTIADRRHILELKNNGNAAFDGNITVSGNVYNLLELKRTDSAYGAGIKFYNNNGLLGSICMTGTADGGLKRYKSDDSTSYTFLDTGNFSISRSLTSGTKIATITIDGTATDLYCQTNTNTDTMVTQTETSTDANYEVLFSGTADSTTRTEGARKSTGLKFNPNYKRLTFDAWEIPDITGSTADLNSYTDASGNYKYRRFRCITTGGGSNILNKPADSPFVLEVILIRWASSTDYITKQIYHCYNKKTYQRFCTNGTWDAWTEIKTTDTNTTYTFATGSTQGAFTVTPAGGTAQTVKIHDLGNIYTTATNHNASDDLDWNLYVNNGWHMASNAANSPDSSVTWWIGIVSRHNEKYITQDVWSFTDSANNIARHYVRRKVNNVWGQWNEVKYTDTTYGAEKGISLTSGKFGHSNTAITALTTAALKKITYDAYGHITGTAAVAAADLPSHTHLYAKSETAGGPAYSVAGTAGTNDAESRVWFSLSSDSERRAYDDDFTYNPSKNNLKIGGIKSGRTTSTYLAGNQGSAIIESLATAGAYVMLAKMNSTNGVFTHGTYQTRYELHYTSNTTINAGTNSVDKNVTLLDESGNAVWPGHIRSNTRLIAYSATPSAALQSGHLIIGSTSSAYNASGDGGNGGDVAMEFWRGKSASWQILNSGGNLYFRTNYKDSAAQSSYSVTSFSIAHSSGDLTFTGIANFNNHINFASVTSTTYPALSKKIVFNGSTDGADIYYRVDASDAGRLVLNLRDDSNTKICFALNGTDFATIDTSGVYSGTATTATNAVNAKVTVTNPDATTSYGLVFALNPSTTENNALRKNNNIRTNQLKGTTSALGLSELVLGNNIAKDADANSYGRLGIYSKQSYYYRLEPPDTTTAHRTHKFTNADGNIALLKYANSFWGLIDGDGSDQNWIRTTKYGIIPYASDSDATYGHTTQIGTGTWHFAHAYVDNYAAKTVTADNIDSITGSSFIAGNNLVGGAYDWIGIQAYASNDKFQMLANSNRIIFRQNDTGGTNTANWNEWVSCMAPSDVTGSGGITATVVTSDIGTLKVGRSVTISHSNSITAVTTAVFKKFTYDAQGHITGSAAVAAADLPSHTHSYLPLTGGTVTGAISQKETTYDASLANNGRSSGIGYPTTFNIIDKNDKIMVRTEGNINSNGNIGWYAYVRNYDTSGTQVGQKGLSFNMNKSGNLTWKVDDAAAFKTAIGNPERQVRQSVTTTTNYRPILVGANNAAARTGLTTTVDGESYISDNFFVQPSSGCLYATNLVAHTEGTGTVYFSLWRNGGRSFHIENVSGTMYIKTNYAFNSSTNAWDKTSDGSYSTTFFRNELRSGKSVPYNVFDGIIEANQTIVARNANGIRLQYGSYSTIMRNDGSDTYFLLTNAGNQDTNTWNDFRPFAIHNENGVVSIRNGLKIDGYGTSVNTQIGGISSLGRFGSWWQGRDISLLSITMNDSNYRPIISVRTSGNGDWSLGNHNNENLVLTYISSDQYAAGKNPSTTTQVTFYNDGSIGVPNSCEGFRLGGAGGRVTRYKADGPSHYAATSNGWAMGANYYAANTTTRIAAYGVYGPNSTTADHFFVGKAYNDYSLSVPIGATGTIKIRGTSPTITHEYVNGTTTTTFNGRLPHISADFEMRRICLNVDDNSTFSSKPWHKFASVELNGFGLDASAIFLVSNSWGDVPNLTGILIAHIRTVNDNTDKTANKAANTYHLRWLVKAPNIDSTRFKLVCIDPGNRTDPVKVELWLKIGAQWEGWTVKLLHEFQRSASPYPLWNLHEIYGNGSANPTTATSNKTCDSSTLNPSLIQDVNVTQTTNLNIVRPLLIAASSANASNTYQSSSSASAEKRSTSTSYNGAINMTGGAYIKTSLWTSGGSSGKTYTTLCAGSFEATDPNGQFVGLASKAFADEDGNRIRDHYGLKTDKLYESSTTTLSSMSNPITINPGTLSTYDFLTIVIKSDASGTTYHMVQIPALTGFHQIPLTGNGANTALNPIVAAGCINVTTTTNTITLQIYSSNQFTINTSVTKLTTSKVFRIYRVYGVRV